MWIAEDLGFSGGHGNGTEDEQDTFQRKKQIAVWLKGRVSEQDDSEL